MVYSERKVEWLGPGQGNFTILTKGVMSAGSIPVRTHHDGVTHPPIRFSHKSKAKYGIPAQEAERFGTSHQKLEFAVVPAATRSTLPKSSSLCLAIGIIAFMEVVYGHERNALAVAFNNHHLRIFIPLCRLERRQSLAQSVYVILTKELSGAEPI
jgi:hypothetical protein